MYFLKNKNLFNCFAAMKRCMCFQKALTKLQRGLFKTLKSYQKQTNKVRETMLLFDFFLLTCNIYRYCQFCLQSFVFYEQLYLMFVVFGFMCAIICCFTQSAPPRLPTCSQSPFSSGVSTSSSDLVYLFCLLPSSHQWSIWIIHAVVQSPSCFLWFLKVLIICCHVSLFL